LYSLGVTCIHLLTDIHPFDLFNSLEGIWVWQDYLTNPVSNELRQILNKMLEGTVKYRYQSAEEILKDLNPHSPPATTAVQSKKSTTYSPPTAPKTLNLPGTVYALSLVISVRLVQLLLARMGRLLPVVVPIEPSKSGI
jgi:serine/threonine protein kinase